MSGIIPLAVIPIFREAYHRYHLNYEGQDLSKALIGLGPPSAYRPAVKAGLMECAGYNEIARVSNWYRLTAAGVEAFKLFVIQGKLLGHLP